MKGEEHSSDAGPLVSVVMPAYNCARYVRQAVESVLAQTCPDWELLIIDDGSTDATAEVLTGFTDPRIAVHTNAANLGVAAARNRGVRLARGEWVAFLDSDDAWAPDKLAKQLDCLRQNPQAVLFYTGSAFIDEEGRRFSYELPAPKTITYRELLRQNLISCSSVLVRRDCMLRYPMPEQGRLHEDYAVWLQILRREPYACGVNEPLLIYRVSAASKSGNKLAAARMNWNTYRCVGLPLPQAVVSMFHYTVRGLRKYHKMKAGQA